MSFVTAPRAASVQRDIANTEEESTVLIGSSAWIALGLKLEEQQ